MAYLYEIIAKQSRKVFEYIDRWTRASEFGYTYWKIVVLKLASMIVRNFRLSMCAVYYMCDTMSPILMYVAEHIENERMLKIMCRHFPPLLQHRKAFCCCLIAHKNNSTSTRMTENRIECIPMPCCTSGWIKIESGPKSTRLSIKIYDWNSSIP